MQKRDRLLLLILVETNFRVLLVNIIRNPDKSHSSVEMDSQIFQMPQNVITGKGTKVSKSL